MVILRTRNKITDFFMILAWASPFKIQIILDVSILWVDKELFSFLIIFICTTEFSVAMVTRLNIGIASAGYKYKWLSFHMTSSANRRRHSFF